MALKGKLEQKHVVVKIIVWLACIFLLSIPAMGSVLIFPQPFTTAALKWIQLIQASTMFLLPPLVMAYLWSTKPMEWLKLAPAEGNKACGRNCLWAIGIMLIAQPAINMFSQWNQQLALPELLQPLEAWMRAQEETAGKLTEQFLNVTTVGGLLINLGLMALLPAAGEELTFRGVLQGLMTKLDRQSVPHVAIWVTAILFSAIHMQFYGFVPRMLMGALFGYMLAWTGSMWIPMLMHFVNNALAVLLYFMSNRLSWDMEQVDGIGVGDTLWLGIVSLVITIAGIYAFRRSTTMSNASSRISSGN